MILGVLLPLMLLAAAGIMVLLMILCLHDCRGRGRRRLIALLGLSLGALGLLAPGRWVLREYGLDWRSWVMLLLMLALTVGVTGALVQTVLCFRELLGGEWGPDLTVASVVCAVLVLLVGYIGAFFIAACADEGNRTVVWEGQKAVESGPVWLDDTYDYYAYRGPIVQGEWLGSAKHPVE